MRPLAALALTLSLVFAGGALAQTVSSPGPFAGFKSGGKEPIELSADRMEADLGASNITFIGHVSAKQGKRTIYAERMHIIYTEGGEVTSLEATGSVKVRMKDSFATSDRLWLDNKARRIKLTGRPRVVSGDQIVTGSEIVYDIGRERLRVSHPRIEWKTGGKVEVPE